ASSVICGVTTQSKTRAPSIDHSRGVIAHGLVRGVMVNAGNANAFTGIEGANAVSRCALYLAQKIGSSKYEIAIGSTGVIGEKLEYDALLKCVDQLLNNPPKADFEMAAKAIMTTDTFAKGAYSEALLGSKKVKICGIAKGSGMIAPNMATMMAYIITDAVIDSKVMQRCLNGAVKKSFNAISVDSDTSTSDLCLCIATGKASNRLIDDFNDPHLDDFRQALEEVCFDLAMHIIGDGEGIGKLIEVCVRGAENRQAAQKIARSIIDSPLVKVAIGAGDANWGRVVMAAGKSGEAMERDRMCIYFGDHLVAENGSVCPSYVEADLQPYLEGDHIKITLDTGLGGQGCFTMWGNDLGTDYVAINGAYRS
ncbi:MAG: bifunctional glutamate N-acetyltransferase/amino-acid acetyltransferase ArgJ, partial [Pseudomonadota bacterium]